MSGNFRMKLIIILAACVTVSCSQIIYGEDFYLFQLRTTGMTAAKLKSLATNLNKETLAKQKTRVTNFVKSNVPKANQESETGGMIGILENVDNIKKYMAPIWKQIKSSKALGDAKFKEVKAVFTKADYDMMHGMPSVWPLFYKNVKTVVPADKWTKVDAAITKAKTTFEKNNKAIKEKLFPSNPMPGK